MALQKQEARLIRTCQAPSSSFKSLPGGAFMKFTEGAASSWAQLALGDALDVDETAVLARGEQGFRVDAREG
jgi:hypothetical protein